MKILVCTLFIISSAFAEHLFTPLSDEFIEHINSQQLTWKAKRNFGEGISITQIKSLLGSLPDKLRSTLEVVTYADDDDTEIPDSFDARDEWPDCLSIQEIRDQANCGSCWAFAAVEAMTDRICIHSDGKQNTSVSAEDLNSCCGALCGDGCDGGYPAAAWEYWFETGIVSGGLYDDENGCRSYSLAPCAHHVIGDNPNCTASTATPKCEKKCDAGKNANYTDEITKGQKPYALSSIVKDIQLEILKNGPVEASFDVFDDFPTYAEGVYQRIEGAEGLGGHAVKIIGWGTENKTDYWLISNSWNTDWGDKGYFKMLRGKNHCGIESNIVAGLPLLTDAAVQSIVVSKLGLIFAIVNILYFGFHY